MVGPTNLRPTYHFLPSRKPTTLLERAVSGTVSVTKAAHILGVHPNTVRAWTDQGRLRCLRINARGDRRYRIADLEAFLVKVAGPGGSPLAGSTPIVPGSLESEMATIVRPLDARGGTAERRATELRLLAEVARLTAKLTDFDRTLAAIARLLRTAFGYRVVAFVDIRGDQLAFRVADGLDPARFAPISIDQGISGAAIRERRAVFVPDVRTDERYVENLPDVRSEIAVPILLGETPWGALLVSDDRPDILMAIDRELLTAVADQVATAAQNGRLLARLERQLHQAEALRRISADINSKLDLEKILGDLVEHALILFAADRAGVFLRQPDGTYDAPVARGLSASYQEFVRRFPTPSLVSDVLARRRADFAVDYAHDPRGAGVRPAVVQEGFDTIAAAPLLAGDDVLGALTLYHDQRHAWDRSELETLDALAAQASLAINNARNYAQTASWAAQLQSIQQLGARLNRLATVRDIGVAICAELHQLIEYHNVRVYRVEGDDVLPVAWRGEIGEYTGEVEDQLKLKVGQGITGWVARHGISQYLPDAARDPRSATIPGTTDDIDESIVVAPMRFEERVLGVIVLSKLGLHQFRPDDLRLLEIYASFAAQAVINADTTERLRGQSAALERRVRSQTELLRITEAILTTLDPRVVLDEIAERLGALVQHDNLCIDLHDGSAHLLRPLVARGVHADLYLAATTRDDEDLGGWVVQHGEAQLVEDELEDPRVRHFPELGPEAGSLMAVPLHSRDGISGVLTLERLGSGRVFTQEEFELVQLFAAQASIAMQNAEAHQRERVRAQTDGLTGLSNHTTFQEQLARSVAQRERFSLLMLDLDAFKSYNDSFGHPAGDALLRTLAATLRASVREADQVFRYGGDEFTLILPGTDATGARAVAEKVRRAVHGVRTGEGRQRARRLTCSTGLATFPDDGADAQAILLAADRAAYVSKRSGRDRISTAAAGRLLPAEVLLAAPTPVDQPAELLSTS